MPKTRVVLWDVDTQVDFMHADGKLYVPGAESIIPNLKRLTDYAHQHGIRIVASADDHVAGHRELSDQPDFRETFPLHCMRGTPGQRKIPDGRPHGHEFGLHTGHPARVPLRDVFKGFTGGAGLAPAGATSREVACAFKGWLKVRSTFSQKVRSTLSQRAGSARACGYPHGPCAAVCFVSPSSPGRRPPCADR